MWENVSAVRNKDGLESTLKELNGIKNNDILEVGVSRKEDLYKAIIAGNMVEVAELITHASLLRNESRGCHYREDFPYTNNSQWLKTIHMRLEDGKAKIFLMNPIEVNNFYLKAEEEI